MCFFASRYAPAIKRNWSVLLVVAAVILGFAAVSGVVVRAATDRSPTRTPEVLGSAPPGTITLPEFRLRDYTGRAFGSRELRGRSVLVTFLETKCREACPILASQIGDALRLLSPKERRFVVAVAISTHPHDDTPASVRAFLRTHRVLGRMQYLLGSEAELRPVWNAFFVLSALDSGDADTHSASVRVFDRRGRWISTLHPRVDLTAENLAHDARAGLR
jgi:cytochrome oxidase Cu insertion factor (SCO1/SenC/PrrC family)